MCKYFRIFLMLALSTVSFQCAHTGSLFSEDYEPSKSSGQFKYIRGKSAETNMIQAWFKAVDLYNFHAVNIFSFKSPTEKADILNQASREFRKYMALNKASVNWGEVAYQLEYGVHAKEFSSICWMVKDTNTRLKENNCDNSTELFNAVNTFNVSVYYPFLNAAINR